MTDKVSDLDSRRDEQATVDTFRERFAAIATDRGYSPDRAEEVARIVMRTIERMLTNPLGAGGLFDGRDLDEDARNLIAEATLFITTACIREFEIAVPDLCYPR